MKVALLGDSIRQLGYGKTVEERLTAEGHEVFQPADNCRFAKYTLRMLWDYKEQMKDSDVVHWNNGLWDVCHLMDPDTFCSIEEYVDTMVRIAKILKARHKVVIFATTTPVAPDHSFNKNEDIDAFNAAVVPKLRELGVIINDLGATISSDIPRYIREDRIHLSEAGMEVAANQVTDAILNAIKGI